MGKVRESLPVKLIIGMIAPDEPGFDHAQGVLTEKYGELDYESPVLPFDRTDYYAQEMGEKLLRKFISFKNLFPPDSLSDIKLYTNELEERLSNAGRRTINLDPGYITQAKPVLATTKNHIHRIYIGKGIYAEITLFYKEGSFRPFPWTYPDYRKSEYLKIFEEIRAKLNEDVRLDSASTRCNNKH